mmetsp:Transcript_36280/g.78294  ORF Transcript_36280/g.78294 Transcript_36280/m.78294 type:complete len:275 (-) Transcript_36280:69-893(-)
MANSHRHHSLRHISRKGNGGTPPRRRSQHRTRILQHGRTPGIHVLHPPFPGLSLQIRRRIPAHDSIGGTGKRGALETPSTSGARRHYQPVEVEGCFSENHGVPVWFLVEGDVLGLSTGEYAADVQRSRSWKSMAEGRCELSRSLFGDCAAFVGGIRHLGWCGFVHGTGQISLKLGMPVQLALVAYHYGMRFMWNVDLMLILSLPSPECPSAGSLGSTHEFHAFVLDSSYISSIYSVEKSRQSKRELLRFEMQVERNDHEHGACRNGFLCSHTHL